MPRISVQIEGTLLAAMQQHLSTKQGRGKRLIKCDNISPETYKKILATKEARGCSFGLLMQDALTFQLNAMHLATKSFDRSVFPKCSTASFLGQAAALYTSFETAEEREAWLRSL